MSGGVFASPSDYHPGRSIIDNFPASWRTDITVLRGGGRDLKGNPQPVEEILVTRCLLAPRATVDPVDRSDVVDAKAMLYRGPGFSFRPTDRIRVPTSSRMAGDWAVDGLPSEWPFGSEVGLVRA